MSSRFGGKATAMFTMNIKGTYYYEILAENETINATCCFELLKRLMKRCTAIESTHSGYLIITLDLIAMSSLLPGLSKRMSNFRLNLFILPT